MAVNTTYPAPAQPKRYLSPQEFSQLSGLSLTTVHRYLRSGKLRHLQLAGPRSRILIPIDALEASTVATPGPAAAETTAAATSSANLPPPATLSRLSGPRPRWARRDGP
jgi:hypothetical protein